MDNHYESRRSTRDELRQHCRAFFEILTDKYAWDLPNPDRQTRYGKRLEALKQALEEFLAAEMNFDSRAGRGLAENIVRALPLKTQVPREAFRLYQVKRTSKKPQVSGQTADTDAPPAFTPADLAHLLAEAYRRDGWGEMEPGEDPDDPSAECVNPDLLCSELNNFFSGVEKILRRRERDRALLSNRQDETSASKPDTLLVRRLKKIDPQAPQIFSWRCCAFCFRLIPELPNGGNAIKGKTCWLHDPRLNPARYRAAKRRFDALRKRGPEIRRSTPPQDGPQPETPLRLRHIMKTALLAQNWSLIDPLYNVVYKIFSTASDKTVDSVLLKAFRKRVLRDFPPIVQPDRFCDAISQAEQNAEHTPVRLHKIFSTFLVDEDLPLIPRLIALYVVLFREEAWYAENFDKKYYASSKKT